MKAFKNASAYVEGAGIIKTDILFDEKMSSSIHLAIGSSYDDCFNGNKSAVHLDLIQSHLPENGGGKIYFDNQLIYENGEFLLPNLVDLNN